MSALLLCAMLFTSEERIPAALEAGYRRAFGCPAVTVDAAPRVPATNRLDEINRYFPDPPKIWPVVAWNAPESERQIAEHARRGIRPGLLLPDITATLAGDSALLDRLETARRAGALPVARLPEARPEEQALVRRFWCGLGLCPLAWQLPRGLGATLVRLAPGLYLSPPHWYDHPSWPLPDRAMNWAGRTVIPLRERLPDSGGTIALLGAPPNERLFTPAFEPLRWNWGAFEYRQGLDGVQASPPGALLLKAHGLSLRLWSAIHSGRTRLLTSASTAFAWVSLGLILLNLVFYLTLAFRRLWPSPVRAR